MWQYNKTTRKCFTLIILQRRHKRQNTDWPEIPDHPHRILIAGGSASVKTKCLLNIISHEPDINKIYLCAKNRYEAKYFSK